MIMKKFFTLLLSSLFSLSLLAYDGSRLTISTASNHMDLNVEVDGTSFLLQDNCITLNDLSVGYHDVKIYREKKRNSYGFGRRDIIYSNSIYLKKGISVGITINRFGTVMVDERQMDRHDGWYYENNDNSTKDNDYDEGSYRNSDVMSAREFDQVKYAISKEWFDNNRLISVKTILDNNSFTVFQVKELMQLFSFENNKLEVAKYAYRKTVDKENYYKVSDGLTYSSSKEELARFIRTSR
jgi:hypothetical protein